MGEFLDGHAADLAAAGRRIAELEAENQRLREALEMMLEMSEMGGFGKAAAEDVARAALAEGGES